MEIVVQNRHTRETELCNTGDHELSAGDLVVAETRYGTDICAVVGPVSDENRGQWREVRVIHRPVTEEDLARYDRLAEEGREAAAECRERIQVHNLKMNLVSAHYLLDRSKLLFFFTADHRVDFRTLVRDLVSRFHIRVELRQIGVRDETRMVGGIGICGRTLCCASVSDRLAPVSIRMAKNQNYSLNSMKVSGPCGRLLCCLAYENEYYESERRRYPKEGTVVSFDGSAFKVQEINVLTGQVRLYADSEGRYMAVPLCALKVRAAESDRRDRWELNLDQCPEHVRTEAGIG